MHAPNAAGVLKNCDQPEAAKTRTNVINRRMDNQVFAVRTMGSSVYLQNYQI